MNIFLSCKLQMTLHVTLKKNFPSTQNVINHCHATDDFPWTHLSKR